MDYWEHISKIEAGTTFQWVTHARGCTVLWRHCSSLTKKKKKKKRRKSSSLSLIRLQCWLWTRRWTRQKPTSLLSRPSDLTGNVPLVSLPPHPVLMLKDWDLQSSVPLQLLSIPNDARGSGDRSLTPALVAVWIMPIWKWQRKKKKWQGRKKAGWRGMAEREGLSDSPTGIVNERTTNCFGLRGDN